MTQGTAASTSRRSQQRYGTRRRALPIALASLAVLAGMAGAVRTGVLAVDFSTTSSAFTVYTDKLAGSDVAAYGGPQATGGGTKGAVQLVVSDATINGLCIVASQSFPVVGTVSGIITAGEQVNDSVSGTDPIALDQVILTGTSVAGNGSGVNQLTVGQSADTLTSGSKPWAGTRSTLGVQASSLTLTGTTIGAYGMQIDSPLSLKNLQIKTTLATPTKAMCAS